MMTIQMIVKVLKYEYAYNNEKYMNGIILQGYKPYVQCISLKNACTVIS